MTNADAITTKQRIDRALQIASELSMRDKSDSAAATVVDQLSYLKEMYERNGNLKFVPKGKMTIGVIAAREYDTAHPVLADLLYKIDWAIDHAE